MAQTLLQTLAGIVGAAHLLSDPSLRAGYERDWTGRWRGEALAVVRPADTEQVAAVVRACAGQGAAIVPQGGNTGLVGGGVPRPARDGGDAEQVVLSTARLNAIGGVDTGTAQLEAGAGVTLADARRAARSAGLDLALDLAARDSATLGGLLACDAGGLRALRHGTARRQLSGLEAVLADGTIVESRMAGLVKDTAGYDLGALLVGSEGTLGVITAVRWSLAPRRDARAVALAGLQDAEQAVALVRALRPALPELEVCEVMERAGIELSCAHLGITAPGAALSPVSVLLECAAPSGDPIDALADALQAAGAADRTVIAADAAARERLIAIRESHAEAINAQGVPLKFDVGVPLSGLGGFWARVGEVVRTRSPRAQTIIFGHLGDGNLHVNVIGAPESEVETLEDAVLELAAECGGTVSAEHGIGVHKVRHLALTRSPGELEAMRAIKRALDPMGILNPGVALSAA
ncbi:MAG TPA: FAD-binding oxidoreductase [Solirubrobacteraceae bacterium]|nr:FAD-binding oxidoreductase [Solirubrobacteraceae bacterium]